MALSPEVALENSRSWFRYYKEYNIVRTSFQDQVNLKQKMCCPEVIQAIRVWMKSNDDYKKKKHDYHANKTSEGWEAWQHSEWVSSFNVNKVIRLVEGPVFHIDNYSEWLIQKKKKMPKELPDDVLSIIREYSKPVFRWYKEYNEARSLLELNFREQDLIKLKERMDDPTVREQVKICLEACHETYQKGQLDYYCKEQWWFSISIGKLGGMIYDKQYRMVNYEEWVFKDDTDDAWMDSDNEYDFDEYDRDEWEEELIQYYRR